MMNFRIVIYLQTTVKDEKSEISRLCRQMDSTTITVASARKKLKCRYNRWNSPFLRIAPLKEEELLSKPKILLYHQVVRELEAEYIVDLSLSKVICIRNYMNWLFVVEFYKISAIKNMIK